MVLRTTIGIMEQWEVGKRIRDAREHAGLSKRAAAKEAKISEARWRQIEDGYVIRNKTKEPPNPTAEVLARMCDVVGIPSQEILKLAGFPEPTQMQYRYSLKNEHLDLDGIDIADIPAVQAFVDILRQKKGR